VIEKKPEEFKIRCMKDIQSLFSDPNSLYAGFGNKINVSTDVLGILGIITPDALN